MTPSPGPGGPPSEALTRNLAALDQHLARFRKDGLAHLIAGKLLPSASGATFTTDSPIDGKPIAEVPRGTAEDIARAAAAAHAAFPAWRALSAVKRRAILHAIADAIEARADEIALLECWDTGQAHRFMSKAALRGAENFRFFADRAGEARNGEWLPTDGQVNFTTRNPIGAVGVITPWNTPFMLSTWKIAPALAAGCTVVHKPAEWSPITAQLLAEIALAAGLPAGVLNVVHGLGEEAGKALTMHPDIKAVAFVGESATGSAIMQQGSQTLKRVHFELGGKNAVIVFADADLERALDAVVFMIYSLNGERCTSSSRLLIEESVAESFLSRLAERVKKLRVGHPLDPATEVGPLIHARHKEKILAYFEIARREGATVAVGGTATAGPGGGHYVAPTLFTGARPEMKIAQDEIFGPVLTTLTFRDEAQAIALANGVRYGLAGYLWTRHIERALRVADQFEVGMVWINSENVRYLPTPFGGAKASGIGRDGGDYSFEFYMETKNVAIASGTHSIPKLGAG
jgi:5-carboxymethyl-2-hydroxymuconic-semialdehyde dehydrogenase